jgi:predicted TIM-barrel enzyme
LDFQYIRAESFVFSHVADEGLMNACAGQLLRYRKQLGIEEKVAVFTDIKVP